MGGYAIYMRYEGDYYEYMACYHNELIVMHKDPYHVFDSIQGKRFTIKETSST